MKHRLFSIYERLVLRRPMLTLLVTLVVIGWLSTHIPNFKLDASADSLVLEGDQALKYYREVSKRYESQDFLLVTFTPKGKLLSRPVLNELDKMRGELATVDGVASVVSILDVPLLESPPVTLDEVADGKIRTLRDPDIDFKLVAKELHDSPFYSDLLTSPDGKTTALQVNLKRDEKYHTLLQRRESLRELKAKGPLTEEQTQQLEQAQKEFRDYNAVLNDRRSKLVDKVRTVLDHYRADGQIFLGGVPMIASDMITFVKKDLVTFGTGIIAFIVIIMALIFRRFTWVALPLLTCVLTAAFMLGLITWLDWRMTVISSNFVALLLIITLSITIHLVVRYREQLSLHPGLNQRELVRQMVYFMIKPCIYTTLTTIVAFASLVFSGIRPVIDFGMMMTVGVTAALVLTFIILPAGLSLLKRPELEATGTGTSGVETTLWFATFTEKHGKLILTASLALLFISVYGISELKVENRFIDYFHKSTEIYQGMEVIDKKLGGTIPLEIVIDAPKDGNPAPVTESTEKTVQSADAGRGNAKDKAGTSSGDAPDQVAGDEFDDEFSDFSGDDFSDDFADNRGVKPSVWFNRAGLSRIEQVHDYVDSLDETGKVLSLATGYKLLRKLSPGLDDIQLALILRKLPQDVRSVLIDPYLDQDLDETRILVRVKETSRTLRRDQLLKEIHDHLINDLGFKDKQVHLTGMLVLYNNMLQSLYRSQILTIGVVFFAIVLMFFVLFRSLSIALIAIAPNLLAAGIVLGGMGVAGIPLDIMTVTIAAITVGIAVDDTIHYVHRFMEEFEKDHNYLATMYRCHGSIGKAMFYTSVIIIIGFSILGLSNFKPSIYFGLLTGVAMFAALLGALLLLPQLLITFKPLGPNREDFDKDSRAIPGGH